MKTKIFLLLFALLVTLFAGCASEKESGSSPIPETSSDLISSSCSLSGETDTASDDLVLAELGLSKTAEGGAAPESMRTEHSQNLYVKDFGAIGDGVTDDSMAVTAAIEALRTAGDGSILYFEPNKVYYFGEGSYALSLVGLRNVTVKGENTTILAKSIMGLCLLHANQNVVLNGFRFDYATKPYALAEVVEADLESGEMVIRTDRSLHITEEYRQPVGDYFGVVDREEGRYHIGIDAYRVLNAKEHLYKVACNDVFTGREERMRMLLEGDRFIIPMPHIGQVIEQAFTVLDNRDFTMRNCQVWSAAKFMFFLCGNEGIFRFSNVDILPSPQEEGIRFVGWRDGFHCKENRGRLIWENCSARYLYDDLFNISASMLQVERREARQILLYWPERGTPYAYAQPGDTISFFDTDTGKWIGTTILESVEVSGNAIAVTLKEELEGIRAGAGCKAIVDSLAAPDSRIQGGDFQGTFRFRSPLYVTDSRLHVTRMWLNAEPPLEGPIARNILFSHCDFTFDRNGQKFLHIDSGNRRWASAGDKAYCVRNILFRYCHIKRDCVDIGPAEEAGGLVRFEHCSEG